MRFPQSFSQNLKYKKTPIIMLKHTDDHEINNLSLFKKIEKY